MSRIRIAFAKRRFFCFVRHVELPQLFGRVARRAGITIELTQGMSPHPHISLGPALPVGVVALRESAEIWVSDPPPMNELTFRLNEKVPSGLQFLLAAEVDGPSLNKVITAGEYWFCLRKPGNREQIESALSRSLSTEVFLDFEQKDDGFEISISDPSSFGPGAIVKALTASGLISGWPDICIVRTALGKWNLRQKKVIPLL